MKELEEVIRNLLYEYHHADYANLVVRMPESDLERFSVKAMETYPIPETTSSGSLVSKICGIPVEIDDSLDEAEIIFRLPSLRGKLMTDKWKHFNHWYIRKPDGSQLDLNTGEAADYVLSLIERVQVLEAQARKRQAQRSRSRKVKDDDDGEQ
jgi:hypothetical protein